MSSGVSSRSHIVHSRAGRVLRLFGEEIIVQLDGQQTGGKYSVFLEFTPPGGGPPPHTLPVDEWLFVLEGQVQFFTDGKWVEAPVGTSLFAPRGAAHTFKNVGN